jgi:AAA+ superfamily predicted ATPase
MESSINKKLKRHLEFNKNYEESSKKTKNLYKLFELSNNKTLKLNNQLSNDYYLHYEYDIETLDDIIVLGEFYHSKFYDKNKHANISFFNIYRLKNPVQNLLSMIGLDELKSQILTLIVFYLQKLDESNQDMLHTVVYGGPGVGKTKFIHILSEIYANLGVLPTKKVSFVKRADLVGQYLGHTAIKTKQAIEEAKGGILVIDEAYSLGDTEQKDSFSRECIDTLNQFLSEEKKDIVCVIAGYKDDLDKRFFKTNPGLKRRFPFKFTIADYTPSQLKDIFYTIVKENKWDITKDAVSTELLKEHKDSFLFNGGDMEIIFTKTKFIHSLRVFSAEKKDKKTITKEDFEKALKEFTDANPKTCVNPALSSLYM